MKLRTAGWDRLPVVFWVLAVTAIAIWSQVPGYVVGWDLEVYRNAILSLRAGHDPYADGIAVQRAFHALAHHAPNAPTPFTYVYSPITLPLLGWIARFSFTWSGAVYWTLLAAAVVATLWVGVQAVEPQERRVFALLMPAAVFFPGLLQNDVLFSGNVAYILYGVVLAAAWVGWRRGQWAWFYAAVLAASCCKAPLLSLLALPVLSARRQWLPAGATGAAGVALFALQPYVWPVLFRHYLEAVELQFSFNLDFSSSPAGLLTKAFYGVLPYQPASVVFYLLYAVPVFAVLLRLRKGFLEGRMTLGQWMPVVLVGTVLLNPRIMEYDVAPIAPAMALLVWRFFARGRTLRQTILWAAAVFAVANVAAAFNWRLTEGVLLLAVFAAGVWTLRAKAEGAQSVDASH